MTSERACSMRGTILTPHMRSGPPICPLRQLKLLPAVYRCGLGPGGDKGLVWAVQVATCELNGCFRENLSLTHQDYHQ